MITAGEELGPGVAEKIGDDDDERSLNGNIGRFELKGQTVFMSTDRGMSAYLVDLRHDGLEARENRGKKNAPESQRWLAVISQGQKMLSSIGACDDDSVVSGLFTVIVFVGIVHRRDTFELGVCLFCDICRVDLFTDRAVARWLSVEIAGLAFDHGG